MRSTLFRFLCISLCALSFSLPATPIQTDASRGNPALPGDNATPSLVSPLNTPSITRPEDIAVSFEDLETDRDAPPASIAAQPSTVIGDTVDANLNTNNHTEADTDTNDTSESLFDGIGETKENFGGISSYGSLFGETTQNGVAPSKGRNAFMDSVFDPNAYQEPPSDDSEDHEQNTPNAPKAKQHDVNLKRLLRDNTAEDSVIRDLANSAQNFYRSHDFGGTDYYGSNDSASAGFGHAQYGAQTNLLGDSMAVEAQQQQAVGPQRNWGEESFTIKMITFFVSWKGALTLIFFFMVYTFFSKLFSH